MARYIDADLLEKELYHNGLCTGVILGKHSGECDLVEYIVSNQPTADVKEAVRGEWAWDCEYLKCSKCGFYPRHIMDADSDFHPDMNYGETLNFCPYCGADMKGRKT